MNSFIKRLSASPTVKMWVYQLDGTGSPYVGQDLTCAAFLLHVYEHIHISVVSSGIQVDVTS